MLLAPLTLGGIAAVLLALGAFWLHGGRWVSADNAYVRAAKPMLSTDVSGLVTLPTASLIFLMRGTRPAPVSMDHAVMD